MKNLLVALVVVRCRLKNDAMFYYYARQRRFVSRRPVAKFISISSKPVLYKKPHDPPTYRQRRLLPGLEKPRVQDSNRRLLPAIKTGRVQKPVVKKVVKKTQEIKVEEPKIADVKIADASVNKEDPPPSEPSQKEPNPSEKTLYELNSLMSGAVEAELQDIMAKIQEVLSEPPGSNKAEDFVVNKFKNETGEYLKNVLGVNVTKRLLDVYNDLFVKLEFLSKPSNYHIKAFIKTYSPVSVKRLKGANQFMVHVRRIKDFDTLCKAKEIRCGNIKAIITPVYKFTAGPVGLKSVYKQKLEKAEMSTGQKTSNETTAKESNVNVKIETEDKIKPENAVEIKQNTVEVVDKEVVVKAEEKQDPDKNIDQPTPAKVVENQVPAKKADEATTANVLQKQNPIKIEKENSAQKFKEVPPKTDQSTPVTAVEKQSSAQRVPKITPGKAVEKNVVPTPAAKVDPIPAKKAEESTTANTVQKQAATKTVEKQNPVEKVESTPAKKVDQTTAKVVQEPSEQPIKKVVNVSKNETPKSDDKTAVKQVAKPKQVTKKPTTPKLTEKPANKAQNKVTTRLATKEPPKPKFNTRKSKEMVPVFEEDLEGNEELTDQDILALMKGAIVLDECLGSDDE